MNLEITNLDTVNLGIMNLDIDPDIDLAITL
jgi:hypothetical protein